MKVISTHKAIKKLRFPKRCRSVRFTH